MESMNQSTHSSSSSSSSNANSNTKRRRQRRSEKVDYISNLPINVLLHIFSFLPLQYWIMMSLVSKKWKYLWTEVPTVVIHEPELVQKIMEKYDWCSLCTEFHCRDPINEWHPHFIEAAQKKFESFVDRLLLFHSGCTINKFSLFLNHNNLERYASRVDTWVHFVMTSNIERLELNFSGGRPGYTRLGLAEGRPISGLPYTLKGHSFAPKILKTMTLHCCSFKANTFAVFESLQSLSLSEVDILDSSIGDLLSKCRVLKALSLKLCLLPNDFMICNEELNINKLLFIDCMTYFLTAIPIDIIAPNLSILAIDGAYPKRLSIKKANKLLDVKISIKGKLANPTQGNLLAAILTELRQCRYLVLNSWCIQVLPTRENHRCRLPLEFQNVRKLRLRVGMIKQELPGLSCLIRCCPKLESLYLEHDRPLILDWGNFHIIQNEYEAENYWESQSSPFYCLQSCLKNVYMYDFTGGSIEIELVKFLLQNAMVLENLSIFLYKPRALSMERRLMYMGSMFRVSDLVTSFTRGSADAKLMMAF